MAHTGPIDRPTASADEVRYLLDSVRAVLDVDLGPRDIISTFAGIRPLADDGETDGDTAALSREERIAEPRPGLFTVRGGKYTTYRRVAERVVNRVVARLGFGGPSMTSEMPVLGAAPQETLATTARSLAESGWDPEVARRLLKRHGTEASEVAAAATSLGLDGPLVPGLPYLEVEAWWAIHREHALSIDDVLSRRTRIAIEVSDHGDAAVGPIADLLGQVLGWDSNQRTRAAGEYRESAAREYGVPELGSVSYEVRT